MRFNQAYFFLAVAAVLLTVNQLARQANDATITRSLASSTFSLNGSVYLDAERFLSVLGLSSANTLPLPLQQSPLLQLGVGGVGRRAPPPPPPPQSPAQQCLAGKAKAAARLAAAAGGMLLQQQQQQQQHPCPPTTSQQRPLREIAHCLAVVWHAGDGRGGNVDSRWDAMAESVLVVPNAAGGSSKQMQQQQQQQDPFLSTAALFVDGLAAALLDAYWGGLPKQGSGAGAATEKAMRDGLSTWADHVSTMAAAAAVSGDGGGGDGGGGGGGGDGGGGTLDAFNGNSTAVANSGGSKENAMPSTTLASSPYLPVVKGRCVDNNGLELKHLWQSLKIKTMDACVAECNRRVACQAYAVKGGTVCKFTSAVLSSKH